MCTYSLVGCCLPFSICDLSWEVMETPPPPWGRGEVSPPLLGMIGCTPLPHHYKSKKPSVNTQLTLPYIQNSNASYLPYFSCHYPTDGDRFPRATIERTKQVNGPTYYVKKIIRQMQVIHNRYINNLCAQHRLNIIFNNNQIH